jgi:hypothetical protein
MSEKLRTLIAHLNEMSPRMGEGPYMHTHATVHETFRALNVEEQLQARRLLESRPELKPLISFP